MNSAFVPVQGLIQLLSPLLLQFTTSGGSTFRLWRSLPDSLKPFPPFAGVGPSEVIQDHAWTEDDRVVAVTAAGEVLIIGDCEVKQRFRVAPPPQEATPSAQKSSDARRASGTTAGAGSQEIELHAVTTFGTGFVVGGSRGVMEVFELDQLQMGAAALGNDADRGTAVVTEDKQLMAGSKATRRVPFKLLKRVVVRMRPAGSQRDGVVQLLAPTRPTGGDTPAATSTAAGNDSDAEDPIPAVTVRGLTMSPSYDYVGVCVDGGVGYFGLSALNLASHDHATAPIRYAIAGTIDDTPPELFLRGWCCRHAHRCHCLDGLRGGQAAGCDLQ